LLGIVVAQDVRDAKLIPVCRPPRPHHGTIEELAVAIVAIAVTALRDGMRMDAVAVAIGDRETAMRNYPVAMRVIEAAIVGIGVAFTQPRVPFASECRPVALAPLPDRINTTSHRCCGGALQFSSGGDSLPAPYDSMLERHDGRSAQHDGLCHRVASPHHVRRLA
jgi:hypothetical protein